MTELLIKLFVKNHENTENVRVRTAYGVLASVVGIACNVLLFFTKLLIGLIINSISITADAVNNLSDAASSIISLMGVKMAEKPADKEHPFGHGRLEYISALIVSFLILLIGVTLFKNSFDKVIHPEALGFSWILIGILCVSVIVKIWLSLFNANLGKRINSSILKATSADARNDVLVTSVTILSVIITKVTGYTIDGWMGLAVSVFVILAGVGIAKDTLMPLLGEAVDKEVYLNIASKVESYEGILGTHDLIVHNYGPTCSMATIHVEVSNESSIEDAHRVIDKIERDILRDLGISLVIHMDPLETKDYRMAKHKEMVLELIHAIEPDADMHDFRVMEESEKAQFVFDLVVPYSYKDADEQKLKTTLEEAIHKADEAYDCMITIEKSFIAE